MRNVVRLVEALAAFVVGVVAISVLDAANGWWLNSGQEVLRTSLVLLTLGLFAAVWRRAYPRISVAGLWAGAMVEMTTLLFRTGPGTIWPIVLVFAGAITAAALFGGALIGSWLLGRE